MPYSIRKTGRGYSIVARNSGKVVGHSATRKNAQASIRARNAAHHGWKPSR